MADQLIYALDYLRCLTVAHGLVGPHALGKRVRDGELIFVGTFPCG